MIIVKNIFKRYGKKQALKDVSLRIESGEIVGFLGRNGAGKTSLMRILTGFLSADAGEISINGHVLPRQILKAQSLIGYLPETPPLYPDMRVDDYLMYVARLRDIRGRKVREAVDKVLADCRLMDVRQQIISTLSKGYKQRVGIAQAVIHDPAVLILDEPTSGLDPVQIIHIRELIKNLEGSRTVIVSTHILSEIESLVRRVLIIKEGRLVVDERLERLMDPGTAQKKLRLKLLADAGMLRRMFDAHPMFKILSLHAVGDRIDLELEVLRPQESYNGLLQELLVLPARIVELREQALNLEEIFLKWHA